MNISCELINTVGPGCTLGEGVLWNRDRESVFWSDIEENLLLEFNPGILTVSQYKVPSRLCSFGFTGSSSRLLAAFDFGLAFHDISTGRTRWLDRIDPRSGVRFNDGRVDSEGRFWAGTMVESGDEAKAGIFCFDNVCKLTKRYSGIRIANAICWSPDSMRMYFADTAAQEIKECAFDRASSEMGPSSTFARTTGSEFPDGAVTDADGYLWCAIWGGSRVVRFAPNGAVDFEVDVPVSQPTCVAFGGPKMDQLYVSTAKYGMSSDQLAKEPHAGKLLVFQTNVKGLPPNQFRLDSIQAEIAL